MALSRKNEGETHMVFLKTYSQHTQGRVFSDKILNIQYHLLSSSLYLVTGTCKYTYSQERIHLYMDKKITYTCIHSYSYLYSYSDA